MRFLSILLLAGCGSSPAPSPDLAQPLDLAAADLVGAKCATPSVTLTPLVDGLQHPTFAAGDLERLFVLERAGKVRLAVSGALAATPFLDLSSQVHSTGDDDGLLGLALHPQFASSGRLFVQYSDKSANLIIAEYARSAGNPDQATPSAIQTLLTTPIATGIRYGGMLAFGPDNYLYSGVGDGDSDGDPNKNAQNLSSPLGKILRFDVDHPTTPPAGNLMGAVWDYGLREPWRFSFDRMTGELYIADVGHPTYQEIDIEPAGQGGKNWGWPIASASHCLQAGCDQSQLAAPDYEYPKSGGCAIIGGYVHHGNDCLDGYFVFSDYCHASLRAFKKGGSAVELAVSGDLVTVTSFGEASDGTLLVVDYGAGKILRLDPN
jgi:glucose/arabinose dehydrogenase